ncbi:MAG: ATPase P [Desulfohalobiaceae bacterium]
MLELDIPDFGQLRLEHLVLDYNGTLAVDGQPAKGIQEKLDLLSQQMQVHVITADTFGHVRSILQGWPCTIKILEPGDQARQKWSYVQGLGAKQCVCAGNGRNDRFMLESAGLGLAVMLEEGSAQEAIQAADITLPGILPALELLLNPLRLIATLRS